MQGKKEMQRDNAKGEEDDAPQVSEYQCVKEILVQENGMESQESA